jgi:hypothetical protein
VRRQTALPENFSRPVSGGQATFQTFVGIINNFTGKKLFFLYNPLNLPYGAI